MGVDVSDLITEHQSRLVTLLGPGAASPRVRRAIEQFSERVLERGAEVESPTPLEHPLVAIDAPHRLPAEMPPDRRPTRPNKRPER